nr:C39 family peptidase [uncultured Acetatifactor sp.]
MMGYYRTMERKAAGGRTVQPYMERFSAGQQGTGSRGRQGTEGRRAQIPDIRQQGPRPQDRSRTGTAQRELRRRRRRRRQALGFLRFAVCLFLVFGILVMVKGGIALAASLGRALGMGREEETRSLILPEEDAAALYGDRYGEKLAELLERNEEAADYVESYPEREAYKSQPIDLTQELQSGSVPLLMQWDKRWGYDAYGSNMIGLAGCGPVCLTMAYLHFTGDAAMTPREMAAFAYDNGYYTEDAGTKWSLWTEGVGKLGLVGEELPLDENRMKQALDDGKVIVCSMGPGDFTTEGHFILIRGYDGNGFYVNDPNRRSNSEKQWEFDTLRSQIRNLWSLYG